MTSDEAAQVLGIKRERIRHLVASGQLTKLGHTGRSMILDPASVHRLANKGIHPGRPWTPQTAWAALSLLSGGGAGWLIPPRRSRIKATLRDPATTARAVHALARHKDQTFRYRAHPATVPAVARHLAPSGATALTDEGLASRFGLATTHGTAEGYVAAGEAVDLAEHFALAPDASGNIVIREVDLAEPFATGATPLAAIAVDLMDSLATRERSAGERVLTGLLEDFRHAHA